MKHKMIIVTYMDETTDTVVVDVVNGVRIENGVARFGRTEDVRWTELLAAPLVNIKKWE